MLTGQAQRLTLRPTPVSAPFSIPVCFRAQAHPPYRPPIAPWIEMFSWCCRNPRQAWQRSSQGLEEQEVRHFYRRGDRRGGSQEEARPAPQGTHHSYLVRLSRSVFSSFIIFPFTFPHAQRKAEDEGVDPPPKRKRGRPPKNPKPDTDEDADHVEPAAESSTATTTTTTKKKRAGRPRKVAND